MNAISRFAMVLYAIGALCGLLSVALAAFAAHALANVAPTGEQAVIWFKEATAFQMNHALALIFVAAISDRLQGAGGRNLMRAAAVFLAAGAILVPGSLYSVSFGGPVFLAPFGGTAAMIGWALFGVGAVVAYVKRQPTPEQDF